MYEETIKQELVNYEKILAVLCSEKRWHKMRLDDTEKEIRIYTERYDKCITKLVEIDKSNKRHKEEVNSFKNVFERGFK